jgi:hypothetical protein
LVLLVPVFRNLSETCPSQSYLSFNCNTEVYLTAAFEVFSKPNHFEQSHEKRKKNISDFPNLEYSILEKSRQSTLVKRLLMGKPPEKKKIYDDELVRAISEEFNDRIRTVPIFGI